MTDEETALGKNSLFNSLLLWEKVSRLAVTDEECEEISPIPCHPERNAVESNAERAARRGLTGYGEMKPPLDLFALRRPIRLRSALLRFAQGDSVLGASLRATDDRCTHRA